MTSHNLSYFEMVAALYIVQTRHDITKIKMFLNCKKYLIIY